MQNHFKKFLSLGLITLFFTVFVSFSNVARGSLTDNISGLAWEANDWVDKNSNGVFNAGETMSPSGGTGWISFNCTSDISGTCASSDYGVNVNSTTGYMTGYAWSSNYGWLKFGGLSGFPTGSGTTADDAKIDFSAAGTSKPVTGWARFCAVYATGCSGALALNNTRGDWDGWISFSGTGYGVTLNTSDNDFDGYAWGGNSGAGNIGKNVVGWISFNCENAGAGGCTSSYKVSYTPPGTPEVELTATSLGGDIYRLSWVGQNLASGNSCTATQSGGGSSGWPGTRPSSGTFDTSALADGAYDFIITCNGASGGTAVDNVVVNVGIGVDLQQTGSVPYAPDYETTLSWYVVNGTSLSNCVADSASPLNPASVSSWTGPIPNPPSFKTVNVPYNPTWFKITCTDSFGNTVTDTQAVAQDTLPESVLLSNTRVIENPSGSGNYLTDLTWTTVNTNANSCVASNGVGSSWQTPLNKSNPATGSNSQSNIEVPATGSRTYSITCTGQSGNLVTDDITLDKNSGNSVITKPIYIEN